MTYQQQNYLDDAGFNTSSALMTPQEHQDFSLTFNNNPLDNWFSNTADLLLKQNNDPSAFHDILQLLPISPPLTASPVSESNDLVSAEAALVALFPDILQVSTNNTTTPPPRPVAPAPAQQQRLAPVAPKPVAIMPKSAIPIAPRPGGTVFTPSIKRKAEQIDSDEAAQKRQKNTDAARRSRLKKIVKMESLEQKVTELECDNSRLTTRVAVLESEKTALAAKDKGLEDRIRVLEVQLAEAHRALTSKSL